MPVQVTHLVNVKLVSVSKLVGDPKNARRHSKQNLAAIRLSYEQFGQMKPIVVAKDGKTVLAGNGQLEVAREMGLEKIAVVRADHLTPEMAQAYAIADNRTGDLAEWDYVQLSETLNSFQDDLKLAAGFTRVDLHALQTKLEKMKAAANPQEGGSGIFTDEQVINSAFEYFRKNGFPYRSLPMHVCMQELNALSKLDQGQARSSVLGYKIADTYHPHRYHASASGMISPVDGFKKDAKLRKCLQFDLETSGKIGVENSIFQRGLVEGIQACANFRPGYAMYLYRKYGASGGTILDTSTGFGGRLVGFMASKLDGRYIGIDPNTKTHAANLKMAKDLGFASKVKLINKPAEDVGHSEVDNQCDFAFTSPPYFAKELYCDEPTQSWKRYATGESWRDGFLFPMMQLTFAALKRGCLSVINIEDVTIAGKQYPLVKWTIQCAKRAGFKFIERDYFTMGTRNVFANANKDQEKVIEQVLVFKKP